MSESGELRPMKSGVLAGSSASLNLNFSPGHGRTRSAGAEPVDWTPFVARHVRTLYQRRDGAALGEAKMFPRNFSVVAMADISGYSKLTTTLAAKGDESAETLTKIINPYLQFMVDIVEKSGGDVIKFIGDAILMSWDLQGSQEETVASACWGCLRLIERLGDHQIEIPGEENKYLLSMHIGLSVGEVFDVHMGTEQRMEYFLAGRAVKEAVVLVNVAKMREVAISPEALHHLQIFEQNTGVTLGVEGRVGGIILSKMDLSAGVDASGVTYNFSARNAPEPPPPKKIYQRYINESVVSRVLGNPASEFEKFASLNELRRVSVLFLKIEGLNVHSTESIPVLQSTMQVVQGVLKDFDGTLRQMVIDDKGATILTVFGLPPLSHENNSIFGVRAALKLQSLLRHLISFSIGLTTGSVFTGIIGSRKRCDHTILGEPVNLAARMMCSPLSANGGILCDVATQKATKDEIEFLKNEPQNFFKNADPIDCYTVLKQRSTSKAPHLPSIQTDQSTLSLSSTSLIGRQEEMKIIDETFKKFVELQKMDKTPKAEDQEKKPRRKTSVPLINRSLSFNSGSVTPFGQIEIPRVVIEGDGGLGKSSLLTYARDLGLQEGYSICFSKADEVDKSTPYFVYRDIILEVFDLVISHFENHPETPSTEAEPSTATKTDPKDIPYSRSRINSSPNVLRGNEAFFTKKFLNSNATKAPSNQALRSSGNLLAQLQDEAARSNVLDKAGLAMNMLGLDPSVAVYQLIPIFPILDSGKDKSQERKDGAADLVARIFERFTAIIAPIVITIDDAHWMDSQSYKLTWVIVRRCSGVFLVLGSRTQSSHHSEAHAVSNSVSALSLSSIEDEGNTMQMGAVRSSMILTDTGSSPVGLYNKIKGLPATRLMKLKGVSRDAVEKIVTIHCGFPVRSVQEKLLTEIEKKTGGNPLFVERLAANMKGKNIFGVTPSGELVLKGGSQNVVSPLDEFNWGDDPETAVLVQFDRLPSDLQAILRTASVIGQNFTLEMVSQVLETGTVLLRDTFEAITGYPDVQAFIGWEEPDPREKQPSYKMFFKSAVLQKCIYSAMLTDQRQEVHRKVALKYELSLNNSNLAQLLPLIAFHYGHTKDVGKKIQSLDRVSAHYVDTGSYSEAIASLTKLFDLVQNEEKKTDRNPRVKREKYSKWHILLGIAHVGRSEWSKGQRHLFEALSFLDFEFPSTPFKVKMALNKCYMEQKRHWAKRHETRTKRMDPKEVENIKKVCDVLNALYTSFTFIGDGKSAELCLLMQLNFCERVGLEDAKNFKFHFGQIEAATAMLFWMRNKRSLALEYFGRAKSICEYSEIHEDLQNYYTLRSTMLLSSGRIKEATECMELVLGQHKKRTGASGSHVIHVDIALIAMLDGEFDQHRMSVSSVYETAVDNNGDGTQVEAACVMIQNLLLAPPHFPEGTTDVTNWVAVVEEMSDTWSDARSSSIHLMNISSALFLFYSFQNSPKVKPYCDQFLLALESSDSRLRSPLGYLIALYIFFFLLAQHRMFMNCHERKGQVEWKIKDAVRAIRATLRALEVLKGWWSFVTPISYLATGLVQLFQGKPKDAVASWRKGIKRTDEISDNLKFLKAVLQARVVRYSSRDDAMKMEASEFLSKIGARTELAMVVGEAFSPLPLIEESSEAETYEAPLN